MTTWEALVKMYPALATKVAGECPLKNAVDLYAAGDCATKITAKDLATDAKEAAK